MPLVPTDPEADARLPRWRRLPVGIARFCFAGLDLERKVCVTPIVWGVLVIYLDSFHHSSSYDVLTSMVAPTGLDPEWAWGVVAILIGLFQTGGVLSHRLRLRQVGSVLSLFFWLTVNAAFLVQNPHSAALSTFGLFAWSSAAVFFQLGSGRRA